jgi:hypothetical protein
MTVSHIGDHGVRVSTAAVSRSPQLHLEVGGSDG